MKKANYAWVNIQKQARYIRSTRFCLQISTLWAKMCHNTWKLSCFNTRMCLSRPSCYPSLWKEFLRWSTKRLTLSILSIIWVKKWAKICFFIADQPLRGTFSVDFFSSFSLCTPTRTKQKMSCLWIDLCVLNK